MENKEIGRGRKSFRRKEEILISSTIKSFEAKVPGFVCARDDFMVDKKQINTRSQRIHIMSVGLFSLAVLWTVVGTVNAKSPGNTNVAASKQTSQLVLCP